MKKRIVIRIHLLLRERLEQEAAWRGEKLGTLVGEILHTESLRARAQGSAYLLHPLREMYTPNRVNKYGATSGKAQISVFLDEEDFETVKKLSMDNDGLTVINGKIHITDRYTIPGMLLNNELFLGLTNSEEDSF